MTVFDLDELVLKNRRLTALANLRYRKSDRLQWPVRFLQGDSFVELPSGASVSVGIKRTRADTSYLAMATNPAKTGSGSTATYTFDLNLNTEPVVAALATSDTIECFLEVEVVTDAQRLTSQAVPVTLERDIIVGGSAPSPVLAALGGGGFVLKQSSFTAEAGKAYLVGVGPNSGGGSSGEGEGDSGYGSIGSAETEIIITLPPNPQPADAIIILDAFGNWQAANFGQASIPASIYLNGRKLAGQDLSFERLPCSCILTYATPVLGWRMTRIETGRRLDLGYNSTLSLCDQYPDGVMLHNSRGEAYPRFIVRHSSGANVSLGMAYGNPVIEAGTNVPIRIGQQPQPIRTSGFNTLQGRTIEVPFFNDCGSIRQTMAVFLGDWTYAHNLTPGTICYNRSNGRLQVVVENPRPDTLTLTGTTHHLYANTFSLNGTYIWASEGIVRDGFVFPPPHASRTAPIYQNWSGVNPAQIKYVANQKWAIFVNNVEYAYLLWPGNFVYPPLKADYPWIEWKLTSTDEVTDFDLTYDTSAMRWVSLDGSGI